MEKEEEMRGPKRNNVNPREFIDFSRPYMRGMMIFPLLDRRTTQQMGKGKMQGFYSLMVVGNGNGLVGIGEARDMESLINARNKALVDGVKSMDWVDRFEERTIWSEVQSKIGAVKVIMRPRPVGFGLHCNPFIHQATLWLANGSGIKRLVQSATARDGGKLERGLNDLNSSTYKPYYKSHQPPRPKNLRAGGGHQRGSPCQRLSYDLCCNRPFHNPWSSCFRLSRAGCACTGAD
ncbi:hypothetical protein BKA62DRAFT_644347 [Auriculariales sp. MPI-PUGE-AT-0066]|nr:hypothetical protein BKA62DRAFT_644347 [Auriculariales sp. MPI-PUGE-AT-0066]